MSRTNKYYKKSSASIERSRNAILNRMTREDLSEKVTFEQRLSRNWETENNLVN